MLAALRDPPAAHLSRLNQRKRPAQPPRTAIFLPWPAGFLPDGGPKSAEGPMLDPLNKWGLTSARSEIKSVFDSFNTNNDLHAPNHIFELVAVGDCNRNVTKM